MKFYDVVVLGAGPAGLAAALSAKDQGADTLIVEREEKPGGILKQCIHDGFGLIRFKQRLTGPEYAAHYIKSVREAQIPLLLSTYVTKILRTHEGFELILVNSEQGTFNIKAHSLVLANGCRERTAKQVAIHGTRPAGVYTAGTAQYFVNMMGYLPCKKCVLLGSGDIGLIIARRLTLEGAEVLGVFEAKSTPSGLTRNIVQCLEDYKIPLHLSQTITRIIGEDRVEAVEICQVDASMKPIPGTEKMIHCDGVILSVGLIPENEIAEVLGVKLDSATKGPYVDQCFMTLIPGVFSCGNALHINDLVDYVSESGEVAGKEAAAYVKNSPKRQLIPIHYDNKDFLYVVPQFIDIEADNQSPIAYFRSRVPLQNVRILVKCADTVLYDEFYESITPPEMERIQLDLNTCSLSVLSSVEISLLEESK